MSIINKYNVRTHAWAIVFGLLLMPACLTSCGSGDEPNPGAQVDSNNINANTTDKSAYATRLEVPHLKKGTAYPLIVKIDPAIGVNYMLEWDCSKRAQVWTCWEWNSTNSGKDWNRNNWGNGATFNGYGGNGDPFQPDLEIDAAYRSELSDYKGSGYDRGHICASEDRVCNKNANGQTFYLSNMHPQIHDFNGYVWMEMESNLRKWRDSVVGAGGTMYVCKGGTIGDVMLNGKTQTGVIANSSMRIPVPRYFFMAVLVKNAAGYSAMAYWAENKNDHNKGAALQNYIISVSELEQRTGIDFFCNLPDKIEKTVEANVVKEQWK